MRVNNNYHLDPLWNKPSHTRRYYFRHFLNLGMTIFCYLTLIVIFGILGWLLTSFLMKGLIYFHWNIFTNDTPGPMISSGGLRNAIVGSLLITGGSLLFSIPIGLLTGTYLSEYGRNGCFVSCIQFVNDILLSTPSIVIGLFIYNIFVLCFGHFSGWYGAFALATISIPIITRASESVMQLVPQDMREAAIALGISRARVTIFLVYRAVAPGIITGVILATARIVGETAPLLFTALGNNFLTFNMNEPMSTLSLVIYNFAMSPYLNWQKLAWIAAMLITVFVLFMNITARAFLYCIRRYR